MELSSFLYLKWNLGITIQEVKRISINFNKNFVDNQTKYKVQGRPTIENIHTLQKTPTHFRMLIYKPMKGTRM